jgi:benzoate-CoA ligase family protein
LAGQARSGGAIIPRERLNVSELLDANLEAGRGEKVAVFAGDEQVTYGELFERVCRMASALRDLGLEREDRVLLVLDDTPAWPVAFLGAIRVGAVPVPVSPFERVENLEYYLADSYARIVISEADRAEELEDVLRREQAPAQLVVAGDPSGLAGAPSLDELVSGGEEAVPAVDTHRDDMAFWLYSSGSTGRPKGVVHLQHDIPYTCETYARAILGIQETDVTFSSSKLYHAYGLGNNLSFPYSVGASTVLSSGRPRPELVLETAERFRPTLFFSVPTLYNAMLNVPDAAGRDLSSVRVCVSAAEPLAPEILRRWREAFGLDILDGVGSTEALHIYCSNRVGEVRPGTSGRPVPGYEVKLLDDAGRPVPHDEIGNMLVRGDSLLAFYWHQHERTKEAIRGEWFLTGDRYRETEEGYFVYEGRSDDMIKVGGLWVSPIDIENTLVEHPQVSEAAVIGVEAEFTTRVKAFVVCREPRIDDAAFRAELQAWCKERLRRYEYPHFIEFADELPKTLTGKIQRYKLREGS